MAFEVEKGVPLPEGRQSSGVTDVYGWDRLDVGDSIFIGEEHLRTDKEEDLNGMRRRIYNAARKFGTTAGRNRLFRADVVQESRANPNAHVETEPQQILVNGVRVWRLKDKEEAAVEPVAPDA